jgi:hypothetical protein
VTSDDCAPPASRCEKGRCVVGCAANPDGCPAGTSCDPATGECAADVPADDLAQGAGKDLTTGGDLAAPPVDMAQGAPCAISVNEIQTAGAAGSTDEFIELYSGCAAGAPLGGYSLVYEAAAGTTQVPLVAFGAVSIGAAKPYFVAGHKNYAGTADVRYSMTSMAETGGAIGLLDGNGKVVDSAGWGTATNKLVETSAAAAPAVAGSIERLPDGHDSDDNALDFKRTANPTPGGPNQ